MYVAARGLGRCRGMSQGECPGSPGCPGYPDEGLPVEPEGFTTYGAVSGGTYPLAPASSQSLTSWLNANSGKVMIGAAAFFGLVLFAKAGR
jgi:hypothetical protein